MLSHNAKLWNDSGTLAKCLNPTQENFPALKALLHSDDFTAQALTWAARIGGFVLNLSANTSAKDSSGAYSTTALTVSSITGDLPTVDKYILTFASGKTTTASATNGVAGTFGDTVLHGVSAIGQGAAAAGGEVCGATAPAGLTTFNRPTVAMGYVDGVGAAFAGPPYVGYRVICNDTEAALPSSNSTLSIGTNMNSMGASALEPAMVIAAMAGNNDGRRVKMLGLFDFTNPLTLNEIKLASKWMAHNYGYVCPIFLGRS